MIKYLPKIAAEKNKFGESMYHYEDLTLLHVEMLDMCKKYYLDSECSTSTLSEMFPSLCLLLGQINNHDMLIPYSKAAANHPLSVIADSRNLAIIKHPYVRTVVDACWCYFARRIFAINVGLYIFFLFFLVTFFTTHEIKSDGENIDFSPNVPELTVVSRYGVICLALCGLIFEGLQIIAKRWQYFKQAENIIDLTIFSCTFFMMTIT